MPILLQTILLLICSNVFMTIAWYGHLHNLREKPWIVAALISWGIALFEYLLQVPANRIGHERYDMAHLKIVQEVISLSVFVPIALYYGESIRWNYLWAAICILGAVFFIFQGREDGRQIAGSPPTAQAASPAPSPPAPAEQP